MMNNELIVCLSTILPPTPPPPPQPQKKKKIFYVWNLNKCRADRHMPSYAKKIVDMYNKNGEIEKMLSNK